MVPFRKNLAPRNQGASSGKIGFPTSKVARESGVKLKLGVNAYSFDKPLREGSMTLTDAVQFCAQHGVDALDATGYYFPGYPKVPSDEYIYNLKRTGFVNGVAICGTGEGDAHKTVADLKEPIDILFLDADKEGYIDYLNKLLPLVRAGGLVVAHNMTPEMADPNYVKAITTNPQLETVFVNLQAGGIAVTMKKR